MWDRRELPHILHKYHLHSLQLRTNPTFNRKLDEHIGRTSDLHFDYHDIAFTRVLWTIYGIDNEIKVNLISLKDLAQIYEASIRFKLPELGEKVLPDLLADIGERFIWEGESRLVIVDVLSYLEPQYRNRDFPQVLRDLMRYRAVEFRDKFPDGLSALRDLCPRLWKDIENR